jgi:hypothetical protein
LLKQFSKGNDDGPDRLVAFKKYGEFLQNLAVKGCFEVIVGLRLEDVMQDVLLRMKLYLS